MKQTVVFLSVMTLVLSGTSGYLWLRLEQEQGFHKVALARATKLEAWVKGLEKSASPSPADQEFQQESSSGSLLEPLSKVTSNERMESEILSVPEESVVVLSEHKLSIQRMFPDLASALDLKQDDADALLNLLAEHELRSSENPPFVPEGELEWNVNNKPDWVYEVEAEQRRRDQEIAALLGAEKFREWQTYVENAGAAMLVRQLRAVLDGGSNSLYEYQIPFLTTAIAEAQQRYGLESRHHLSPLPTEASGGPAARTAEISRMIEQAEAYNRYLADAAAPYLSEEQFGALENMLNQQLELQRAHRDSARSRAEGEGEKR
jgi:hypothetical protein